MMNDQIKEWIQAGKKHFETKNYSRAQSFFVKVLKTGGRFADVLNALGVIYHQEGKFNDAIKSFEEAVSINPNYTEASLNLAVLYNDLGEYHKSKELFTRIQKKKTPKHLDTIWMSKVANLHADLADLYRGVGHTADAIEEYQKALKLCPQFVDIQTKLGLSYRDMKKSAEAIKTLTKATATNAHYRPAKLQLGLTLYLAGQKKKAAELFQALVKKNPQDEVAAVYLQMCEKSSSPKKSAKK